MIAPKNCRFKNTSKVRCKAIPARSTIHRKSSIQTPTPIAICVASVPQVASRVQTIPRRQFGKRTRRNASICVG